MHGSVLRDGVLTERQRLAEEESENQKQMRWKADAERKQTEQKYQEEKARREEVEASQKDTRHAWIAVRSHSICRRRRWCLEPF